MQRDQARIDRIVAALRDGGLDALVCARPTNVLLLSGYWPVVGTAIAIASADGRVAVLAPADEADLARSGFADIVDTFVPASSGAASGASAAARAPFTALARRLGLRGARIGRDGGEDTEPASYAAVHLYGDALAELVGDAVPGAEQRDAGALLATLRATLTPRELERVARACEIAADAFRTGAAAIRPGATEREVAAAVRAPLSTCAAASERADGFAWCMAGPDAAEAWAAFARSGARRIARGDVVLVHCNSYVDGFWTDITRTFVAGPPAPRVRAMHSAVLDAREAALDVIRAGATGAEVDRATRAELERHGFGDAIRHATGHGVGFAAIAHDAPPKLDRDAPDVLEVGMTCNVEPAVYLPGLGGVRHCDVVCVAEHGARVLTPFLSTAEELVLA
ncbi:MAG TPA: Xaa-Pro peptidase family protein [Gemmatimonadaceae bacterium]|nr:Xaa-Pro peptidase family protein [Gemmatimonadaceae bacterium]